MARINICPVRNRTCDDQNKRLLVITTIYVKLNSYEKSITFF